MWAYIHASSRIQIHDSTVRVVQNNTPRNAAVKLISVLLHVQQVDAKWTQATGPPLWIVVTRR
jgi:hypothetical protein